MSANGESRIESIGTGDYNSNPVDKWESYRKRLEESSAGGGYVASTHAAQPNSIFTV